MKEDTLAKLGRILNPTPSSAVSQKARALSKLDADLAEAIAEHSDNPSEWRT